MSGERRLTALKQQKQRVSDQVKAETNRVKQQRATAKIQQAQQSLNKLKQAAV
jgi:hypothetical protein